MNLNLDGIKINIIYYLLFIIYYCIFILGKTFDDYCKHYLFYLPGFHGMFKENIVNFFDVIDQTIIIDVFQHAIYRWWKSIFWR